MTGRAVEDPRDQIIRLGGSLFACGLARGSGNISVRLDDGSALLTPTNANLAAPSPERIAHLAPNGTHLSGDPASKEAFLHRTIYDARPSASAVVHLHATHSAAVSCMAGLDPADCLPPLTAYHVMKIGRLPLIPYHRPGDSSLAPRIAELAPGHPALLLANHGPIVAGATLAEAIYAIQGAGGDGQAVPAAALRRHATADPRADRRPRPDLRRRQLPPGRAALNAGAPRPEPRAGPAVIRLAANLSTMFTEHPFADRFAAAADAEFEAVKCLFPCDLPADRVAALARENGASALFNLPAGDWAAGESGLGARRPGRRISRGRAGRPPLCAHPRLPQPAPDGRAARRQSRNGPPHAGRQCTLRRRSRRRRRRPRHAAAEPINTRIDMPGCFHDHMAATMAIIAAVARSSVRLQYDIYHMAVMGEDPASTMEDLLPAIGHVQIADFPDRHEPGTGTLDVLALLQRIGALGYHGCVGGEYRRATTTSAGLGRACPLLQQPRPRPPFPSNPEMPR